MADFLTHDMLGTEVIRTAGTGIAARLEEYPEAFRWGCQGPDPLFYRRLWERGGPYHPLANRMHQEDTAGLFLAMARYVSGLRGWAREVCAAYLDGFLCHYSLDSEIHPYVYFLQRKGEAKNSGLWNGTIHCQIETDIDMALYAVRRGRRISDYFPADGHRLPLAQKEQLAQMLSEVVREVYGEGLPEQEAAASFGDTLFFEELLYRHGRVLGHLAFAAGLLNPSWSDFVSNAKVAEPEWDCLNLRRRGWRNLDEPETLRHDSVPQLIETARQKTLTLTEEFEKMLACGTIKRMEFPVSFGNGNGRSK